MLQWDALAASLPSNLQLAIHAISSCEDPLKSASEQDLLVKRADHVFGDAVFFVSQTICSLVELYLHWLQCCEGLSAMGQVRPVAYVQCLEARLSIRELNRLCLNHTRDVDIVAKQLKNNTFRHTIMVQDDNIAPLSEIAKAMSDGIRIRTSLCIGWSSRQSSQLRAAYIRHQESRSATHFHIRPTAKMAEVVAKEGVDLVETLVATNRHRLRGSPFVKALANYFGYYYGTKPYSSLHKGERTRKMTGLQCSMMLRDSLARSTSLTLESKRWLTKEVMTKCLKWNHGKFQALSRNARLALDLHHSKLQESAGFLRLQEYGPFCVLCYSRPFQTHLDCDKHAVCGKCINHMVQLNKLDCPVCLPRPQLHDTGRPGHSRGRILSLDGGGVKGFLQLEVLRMIESEIGLDLPLYRFFDLVVGTSIGESAIPGVDPCLTFRRWSHSTRSWSKAVVRRCL